MDTSSLDLRERRSVKESEKLLSDDHVRFDTFVTRQRKQRKRSALHESIRLILLVVFLIIASVSFWQLHNILIGGVNYLGTVDSHSKFGEYEHYAVSTDAAPCAGVGESLLRRGGSAVDAAIGTLLCMGVVIPNSLGLGGGCLMTLYDASTKKAIVIDGREVAPDYASEDMFANDSLKASRGPLSVGVPGELAAYWKAHKMFGKLQWSELFEGAIKKAQQGHPMVEHMAYALRAYSHARYITPDLAKIYTNDLTGLYYNEGDIIRQPQLAKTLALIQKNGAAEFYGGQTGKNFVEDLRKAGGKLTLENLKRYEALVREPLVFKLDDELTIHTQPPPGSGIVLSVILRVMKELGYYKNSQPRLSPFDANAYYHKLSEAFKFAYGQRAGLEDLPDDPDRMQKLMAKLSSEEFIKRTASKIDDVSHEPSYYGALDYFTEDHGTAHVSVMDAQGNAAAVTTSVNLYFGSGLVSPTTGIVYNDVMDDFVSPGFVNKFGLAPSKFNRIRPGKRPLSSMAPSVFTDKNGDVVLIVGGSGGAKITTAIASVSIRNVFMGENIKSSIDGPRIHHQFLPYKVFHEHNFPQDILSDLRGRGHKTAKIEGRSSVIMAIAAEYHDDIHGTRRKTVTANSDYRKGGTVDGA